MSFLRHFATEFAGSEEGRGKKTGRNKNKGLDAGNAERMKGGSRREKEKEMISLGTEATRILPEGRIFSAARKRSETRWDAANEWKTTDRG